MAATNSVLAIIVRFTLVPEMLGRFLELVGENAALSRNLEPGCDRFDVLLPGDGGPHVVLYELYNTAEDFNDHLTRPHYLAFDAATRSMVLQKEVERLALSNWTPA